jgi:hypothetical protein
MIARIWHGKVSLKNGNTFFEYIKQTGLPGLKKSKGNLGVQIFRRDDDDTSHFVIISFWDFVKSIKCFGGPDYNQARLYPDDSLFLLEIEQVVHYKVLIKD